MRNVTAQRKLQIKTLFFFPPPRRLVRQKGNRILQNDRGREFHRGHETSRRRREPNNCQTCTTFPYYCVSRDGGRREGEFARRAMFAQKKENVCATSNAITVNWPESIRNPRKWIVLSLSRRWNKTVTFPCKFADCNLVESKTAIRRLNKHTPCSSPRFQICISVNKIRWNAFCIRLSIDSRDMYIYIYIYLQMWKMHIDTTLFARL